MSSSSSSSSSLEANAISTVMAGFARTLIRGEREIPCEYSLQHKASQRGGPKIAEKEVVEVQEEAREKILLLVSLLSLEADAVSTAMAGFARQLYCGKREISHYIAFDARPANAVVRR